MVQAVVLLHPIAMVPGGKPATVADFAIPDKKVAIYVDGASFHVGANLRRDLRIRAARREAGWRVEELRAADLRGELPGLHDLLRA